MAEHHHDALDRAAVAGWVARYEDLWRTAGTGRLAQLFTPNVSYSPSPWREPVRGLDEIARFWEAERDGHDERFTMTSEVVAVDGDTAVVRVAVEYDGDRPWRDLWVLRFAADDQVDAFEEWPFAPDTYDGH